MRQQIVHDRGQELGGFDVESEKTSHSCIVARIARRRRWSGGAGKDTRRIRWAEKFGGKG
jgi:hypothetical protein